MMEMVVAYEYIRTDDILSALLSPVSSSCQSLSPSQLPCSVHARSCTYVNVSQLATAQLVANVATVKYTIHKPTIKV